MNLAQPNPRYRTAEDLGPVDREHYEVARTAMGWVTPAEFRDLYARLYSERASGSILPSDYCFNRENKGNTKHPRFLLWDEGRRYRFIGLKGELREASSHVDSALAARRSCEQERRTSKATGATTQASQRPPRPPDVDEDRVREALLAFGTHVDAAELFPTLTPGASELISSDPFAFALATTLDRGTKAEIIWTIPYDLKAALGHLNPERLSAMTEGELDAVLRSLPRKPRYLSAASRTLKQLATYVARDCEGDASKIWQDRMAWEVKRAFEGIYGVGPGIASMAVLLIEKAFGIRFDDVDRRAMDIKPDVHTMRVLFRLGRASEEREQAAIDAARRLHPEFPGGLDGALWAIGRRWCHPVGPNCADCYVYRICARQGL